uniref:Uncharacterized protein n=1 Tax=Oryza nivara TaxID=4536 RepID=A0A0E0FW94_ORYNI
MVGHTRHPHYPLLSVTPLSLFSVSSRRSGVGAAGAGDGGAEAERGGRRRVTGRSDGVSWAERPVSGRTGGGGEGGEEERRRVVGGAAGRTAGEKLRQWPEGRGALTGGRRGAARGPSLLRPQLRQWPAAARSAPPVGSARRRPLSSTGLLRPPSLLRVPAGFARSRPLHSSYRLRAPPSSSTTPPPPRSPP